MKTILDLIGNTPLVEIRNLNPNPKVKIFAKLEYLNPGGSIKDRPALYMIDAGEKSGELTKEKTVIEATSGNTGIGLALVCAVRGYKILLTMSEAVSEERRKILKARGADILLTPGHMGTDGAIEEAYRLARENPNAYFTTDQFNNDANWRSHYYTTAEEIWQQTAGQISTFVATMGTTGTLMGVSRKLKEYNSKIRIVGVEPYLGHKIQGLKNMKEAYCPEIYQKSCLDEKINIEDEEAFDMARRLAKVEGLFVGMSSGAAMAIAQKEATRMDQGVIVVIFPDSGERYLSTALFSAPEKIDLKLFNTMTHAKELFEPLVPGKVSMYSCGPTAHARIHIGECRRFIFSDLLCRYLEFRGYDVTHIMNITDLDDKTIEGSEKARMDLSEYTEKHIETIKNDLALLRIKPASKYPKVSEHVGDMVDLSEKLVAKGVAYEKLRSIYFDISRFPDYGKLSNIDINKIKLGATVDLDEYEKDNPRDFTLMKRIRLSELKRGIYVKTKWGNMRPSWHIQCAAMSMKYLGESFDIHASSRELAFPHHEDMIAIAQAATGKSLARYWIHCDRVLVDGKKVDEKGIRPTLEDITASGYSGREIRYFLLSTHYSKPLNYSRERLEDAKHSLSRLDQCLYALKNIHTAPPCPEPYAEINQLLYDLKQGFVSAMDDDLNISVALASTYKLVKTINTLTNENKIDDASALKLIEMFRSIDTVLNIMDFDDNHPFPPEVQRLIAERENARKEKNWGIADKLRIELERYGVSIKDQKI